MNLKLLRLLQTTVVTGIFLGWFGPSVSYGQITINWTKDYIRDANGTAIAVATPAPSDGDAADAPTGLDHTSVSDSSVTLTWIPSTATDKAGYRIYRGNLPVGTVGSSTVTFIDGTLQPGTTYIYRVAAFDGAGNQSAFSGSHTFTTSGVP